MFAAVLAMAVVASPQMTPFTPAKNGFKFTNSFTNDVVPSLDIRTGGLCGGMSYAALDYYFESMPIPSQPFRPANRTTLQSYLYNRQVDSIVSNVDKWLEVGFNPLGARNTEFFNWGISARRGERIDELKSFIDRGVPAVLCLQGDGKEGNHQIIAIGYDMGRYKGDLGDHKEDFKIFVCDPNYPNATRTLIPDVGRQIYRYQEGGPETWRTYFVDKNYHARRPPAIPNANYPKDGKVYELILDFFTGGDDLRGGDDNVNVVLNLMDGTQQAYENVNLGARWIVNNDESAEVILRKAVLPADIHSLVISTTFRGGIGGDNWDMNSLVVHTLGGGFYNPLKGVGFKRFTGEDKVLTVPINEIKPRAGQVDRLWLTFRTGGDDLRGVNDNANVAVHFRDGLVQTVADVNGGQRWPDNTTNLVQVDLNHAVPPADISRVDVQTTFTGGVGGDNWNLDSLSIRATGNGVDRVIASHGFKRFTGDDRTLEVPVVLPIAGQASKLQLTIRTGGDDLRGGNDNLDLIVSYRDRHTQAVRNVNTGVRWADNTTNIVTVNLDRAAFPGDIVGVDLQTTFGGGFGGDNWNMDFVEVHAIGDGVDRTIFTHGYKRFTGDDKVLSLR